MLKKTKKFCARVLTAAKAKLVGFVQDVFRHTEATVILVAASVGVTAALSTVPMVVALPVFVEATMVIPVVSVLLVLALTKSAEFRTVRRNPALAYI